MSDEMTIVMMSNVYLNRKRLKKGKKFKPTVIMSMKLVLVHVTNISLWMTHYTINDLLL